MGTAPVRCNSNSPNQLTGGPGNTGTKLPTIPKMINNKLKKTKSMSILKDVVLTHMTIKIVGCYKNLN